MKKLTLAILTTCILIASQNSFATTLAYWKFENNLLDSSGNGHHIYYGTPTYSSDKSPNAPGTTSAYNQETFVASYRTPSNDFTIECFFKVDAPFFGSIMGNYNQSMGGIYGFYVWVNHDGTIDITVGNHIYSTLNLSSNTVDNQWHHLAFTMSNTNYLKGYIDGVLLDQKQGITTSAAPFDLYLGGLPYWTGYHGYFDEIRVSSGVLNPSEFLYQSQQTAIPEPLSLILTIIGLGGLGIAKRKK